MLAAHFQFLFIRNTFCAVVKQPGCLGYDQIAVMYHGKCCAGVHDSQCMSITILIQILG